MKTKDKEFKIAKSVFKVSMLLVVLSTSIMFTHLTVQAKEADRYYLGETVNAGEDTGFSEKNEITKKDPHYGWELGEFYVEGFTSIDNTNKNPVFLKTVGDEITLNFSLKQDIKALNGDKSLEIANDKKAFDHELQKEETEFGKGALMIRKIDANQNKKSDPEIYTNYLAGVKKGANTQVTICEEGDYEVALDYSIRDKKIVIPYVDQTIYSTYNDYRIYFTFSVRNGNCMVFPSDVKTGQELTNTSITENGFYLDLANSKYLDINIKKEVLKEGTTGLTEDIRFNKPAKDGEQYTEEGIYTITVSNAYTEEETVKKIYVGKDKVLKAHVTTGYSISDIQALVDEGAKIDEDGTLLLSEEMKQTTDNSSDSTTNSVEKKSSIPIGVFVVVSIGIVLIGYLIWLRMQKKQREQYPIEDLPVDPEEIDDEDSEEVKGDE